MAASLPPLVAAVDDDPEFLDSLCRALEALGFRSLPLSRPGAAFARIRQSGALAVLLDLDMPGRSGFDILQRLRRSARCATLPALLLTGRPSSAALQEGFALGLDDFLRKSDSLEEIAARLRRAVQRREQEFKLRGPLGVGVAELPADSALCLVLDVQILPLLERSDRAECSAAAARAIRSCIERLQEELGELRPAPARQQDDCVWLNSMCVLNLQLKRRLERRLQAANRLLYRICGARWALATDETGLLQRLPLPPLRLAADPLSHRRCEERLADTDSAAARYLLTDEG
ncbi:MAG: response regulator [Leptospirales bacterium]|nr:response regulator [Leptospirales bacterium]